MLQVMHINIVTGNGKATIVAGTNNSNNISIVTWGAVTNGIRWSTTNSTTANVVIQSRTDNFTVISTSDESLSGLIQ